MTEPGCEVLEEFGLTGSITRLGSGSSIGFRVGDVVLKRVRKDCRSYVDQVAEWFKVVHGEKFRVPKPVSTQAGKWMTEGRWTAWTYIEGHHDYAQHVNVSILAIKEFHKEISHIPRPSFLDTDDSLYNRADRLAWDEKLESIHPDLKFEIEILYSLRRPIDGLQNQLIHGDINPQNILLSDNEKPAIIDMAPYWRPAGFALAVYAYWIGPWKENCGVLKNFEDEPEFEQLLLRAALRMLIILSIANSIQDLDRYLVATKMIREFVAAND
jgi:uncharacterized protein (TIGR02569 family)